MAMTEPTELADRLQESDPSALEDVLRHLGTAVLILLRRRFQEVLREEDLEDVLSIGLFRLWTSRDRFDPDKASLRVWFYRICENAARDVLKYGWQKARTLEIQSQVLVIDHCRPSESECVVTRTALQHDLREILAELPETQRTILLADAEARDTVACSLRLGQDLGLPASTIRVYRKRALDHVRREMASRGHVPRDEQSPT